MFFKTFILIIHLSSPALAQAENPYDQYGDFATRTSGYTKFCHSNDIRAPLVARISSRDTRNRCGCPDGLFRSSSLNRCVSFPGGNCTVHSRDGHHIFTCSEFATCWPDSPIDISLDRQNGTCYCDYDAKLDNHTKLCKLRHGSKRCSKMEDCDVMSLLTCRDSVCECLSSNFVYNKGSEKCEAPIGSYCGPTRQPFPNVECDDSSEICHNSRCARGIRG